MLGVLLGNNNIYVCVFLETHLVELKCVERKGHFAEELPTTKGPLDSAHCADYRQNLFTCKAPQSDNMTKYAKIQLIGVHLARWEQINDVENNVQIVQGGTGEYFSGLANKTGHCLTGKPICISYPQVHKEFWLEEAILQMPSMNLRSIQTLDQAY